MRKIIIAIVLVVAAYAVAFAGIINTPPGEGNWRSFVHITLAPSAPVALKVGDYVIGTSTETLKEQWDFTHEVWQIVAITKEHVKLLRAGMEKWGDADIFSEILLRSEFEALKFVRAERLMGETVK